MAPIAGRREPLAEVWCERCPKTSDTVVTLEHVDENHQRVRRDAYLCAKCAAGLLWLAGQLRR